MPSSSPAVLRSALAALVLPSLVACSSSTPEASAADESARGRPAVEVPRGALAAPTTIGIQPVTAVAPHAVGAGYRLSPDSATVRARGQQGLEVQQCVRGETVSEEGLVLVELVPTCARLTDASRVRNWSVNGTVGGSPADGTVTQGAAGATYSAPAAPPAANPVAVSVELAVPGGAKVLLVSNLRVVQDCPAPVCRFTGTARAEDLVGDELRIAGEATVTWNFSHMQGTTAVYLPSGRVSATWTHDDCPITLSAPTHAFVAPRSAAAGSQSRLRVDFTRVPATYSGRGSSEWEGEQSWACPNGGTHTQEGINATWFSGDGVAEANGTVLRGSSRTETMRSRWEFRAQ